MGTMDRPGGTGDQADVPVEVATEPGPWKFTPSGSWLNLDGQSERQLRAGHDQPEQQTDRSQARVEEPGEEGAGGEDEKTMVQGGEQSADVEALPEDNLTGAAEPIKDGPWSPEYGVGTYEADRHGDRILGEAEKMSRLDKGVDGLLKSAGDALDVANNAGKMLGNTLDALGPPANTRTETRVGDLPYIDHRQQHGTDLALGAQGLLVAGTMAVHAYLKLRDNRENLVPQEGR